MCLGGWEGSLPLTWAGSPAGTRKRCVSGLASRTSRRGKLGLQEVEEAAEEVEEGLLDEIEGVAEGRPRCYPGQVHRSRASVWTSISWPEGGDR